MHSPMFDKIKRWYETGVYTEAMVRKLSQKGQITQEELAEILDENDIPVEIKPHVKPYVPAEPEVTEEVIEE